MQHPTQAALAARLTTELLSRGRHGWTETAPAPDDTDLDATPTARRAGAEAGFEIAQSMGIALLGLVVAAAFATALETLGVDVITRIRTELGL